uniref:TAR DNA-binding protein 43 N-terminal domain-containing protein n=1 Tax=Romanomermis culicivorax TaxID=13658 RepID=A0A915IX21_ROMCU
MDSGDVFKEEKIAEELDPDHITVTSGVFEVPIDEDGTISLANIRAQLPGASGLWFPSDDKHRRRIVRYDKKDNKLLPPDGRWTDRTYNMSSKIFEMGFASVIASTSGFMGEKELERYEVASRLLHKSVESVSKLMKQESEAAQQSVPKVRSASISSQMDLFRKASETKLGALTPLVRTKRSLSDHSLPIIAQPEIIQKEVLVDQNREKGISCMKATIANRGAKVLELQNRCQDHETTLKEKNKEIADLKKRLEKKEQEFEFLTLPSEGFGDTRVAQEFQKIRKQLDDTKWKREKLENTVHALHQFALIMKKEAEMAKQKAGFDQNFKLFLTQDKDTAGGERVDEKVKRFEKDLDVARDNLYRQAEEIEHFKW